MFYWEKYFYSPPSGKKNGFLTGEGRAYADPGREFKILINPTLGYLPP